MPATWQQGEAQPHHQEPPQRGRLTQRPQVYPHRAPPRALQGTSYPHLRHTDGYTLELNLIFLLLPKNDTVTCP